MLTIELNFYLVYKNYKNNVIFFSLRLQTASPVPLFLSHRTKENKTSTEVGEANEKFNSLH